MSGLTVESTLKLGEITALHQEKFRAWSVQMSSLGSDSPTGTGMSGSVRARLWVMLAHSSLGRCRRLERHRQQSREAFLFCFLPLIANKETGTFDL